MGRGTLTGGEEAVDDLGEAHAGEVRGDGDGSGRRPQRRWQLRDETHAHLARGVVVHRGDGGRKESDDVVVPVGVAAAAGRAGGGFWPFGSSNAGFIWLGFQWSLVPMFSDRGCGADGRMGELAIGNAILQ